MILERFGILLQQCAKSKSQRLGASLHAFLFKVVSDHDVILCNHLINMYAKCSNLQDAHLLFDIMPDRNLVSWSSLISGYDQAGNPSMSLHIFSQMPLRPNEYVYASISSACGSLLALRQGKQVHAHSLKAGFDKISFVYNSLMSMYMKCGCIDDASSIFSSILNPNSISYNAMITGFAENLQLQKGLELFILLKRQGFHGDQFSYVAVIGICNAKEDLISGQVLHCQTIKLGLDKSAFVGNVILSMYAQCGSVCAVEKTFYSISDKDIITCNTYITACSSFGLHEKVLMVYKKMKNGYLVGPDDFTFASVFAACAELSLVKYGAQIHAHLIRLRLRLDVGVVNAIINMYAKCGSITYANHVFCCMSETNLVSWNTIIIALGYHGFGKMAVEVFEQMKTDGVKPDSVTYIGLLAACSHAGLVDEGKAFFDSMEKVYGMPPKVEHLSCLIDLLGRAGKLEEAEKYANKFPFGNDSIILGSLLSSCRLFGNLVIGERVSKKLLELQPSASSPFVLLSALYASNGRWDGVASAWKMLRGCRVKKELGYSLVVVNGVSVRFTMGEFSHARIEEILETLRSLNFEANWVLPLI
ncbi:Pentatricopeptide repeat-containing protein [Apostasia shenzhenica]|uniref:Pentatricopeptide repeat-containing protein n=1 Tax=Apostasia shenzhenica TaxID=1088818 RepID=A0A2I0ARB3_9ASPA|nr:Pentatricopeptide repeat-containing protein [Apostasia shenzhenica]